MSALAINGFKSHCQTFSKGGEFLLSFFLICENFVVSE